MNSYDGFPNGITDEFCKHAVEAKSQYGTTARALSAEVLFLRQQLVEAEARGRADGIREAIQTVQAQKFSLWNWGPCPEIPEIVQALDALAHAAPSTPATEEPRP